MSKIQQLSAEKSRLKKHQIEVIGLTIIALAIIAVYASTLTSPFVFDDEHNIKDNIYIRLTSLNLENIYAAAFESPIKSRPVSNIGFALNYYLHQENVVGYHAVNIVVHIVTALLFFLLLRTTLTLPAFSLDRDTISLMTLLSTLIWAVHPIQTQSVSYIVQRMNSQATMFFLMSLLLYAHS